MTDRQTRKSASKPQVPGKVRKGAIGVVERNGQMLLIQRAANVSKGGTWCFPGGHVEVGETSREAIRREFLEELGIEVQPFERLGSIRVADSNHVLAVWRVQHVSGEITPDRSEIASFRWVTRAEAGALSPNLPSNEVVLAMMRT